MYINPSDRTYTDTFPLEDIENQTRELEEKGQTLDDVIIAKSDKLNLQNLQDDLRKIGYRKMS